MNRDVRATGIGMAALVSLYALHRVAVASARDTNPLDDDALVMSACAVPRVSGGITAFLSGRRQFAAVLAPGVVASGLVALINFIGALSGAPSDYPGLAGVPLVAALSLWVQVTLVLVGGALVGTWQRSRHA